MAKLNNKTAKPSNRTVNLAGGKTFSRGNEDALVSLLLTSLAEDKFYESADSQIARLNELVGTVDPTFAAKAAVFARDTFGMRSITHLTAIALADTSFPEKRAFYRNVVVRPDDALEIVAGYGLNADGKLAQPLPNAMKRGIADKMSVFRADTLAKYKSEGKALNMFDLINLVRPRSAAINDFMRGKTVTADTWEVALSASKDKKATWSTLVLEEKLGVMALLRNLRNIVETCGDDATVMDAVCAQLTNKDAIMRSRLFPYRFLAAYETFMRSGFGVRDVKAPQKILTAINRAAEISLVNVPELPGSSALLLDVSASMNNTMSDRSKMRMIDAGAMLGAMLFKKNPDSELVQYGNSAVVLNVNADMPLLEIAKIFAQNPGIGHGTNLQEGFAKLEGKHDRVIVVSDMQTWGETRYHGQDSRQGYRDYSSRMGITPFAYEVDLAGHGHSALNDRDAKVFHLSTISDKAFILMGGLESGGNGLVEAIKATSL